MCAMSCAVLFVGDLNENMLEFMETLAHFRPTHHTNAHHFQGFYGVQHDPDDLMCKSKTLNNLTKCLCIFHMVCATEVIATIRQQPAATCSYLQLQVVTALSLPCHAQFRKGAALTLRDEAEFNEMTHKQGNNVRGVCWEGAFAVLVG